MFGRISKSFEQMKDSFGRIISELFRQNSIHKTDAERERFVNVTDDYTYKSG